MSSSPADRQVDGDRHVADVDAVRVEIVGEAHRAVRPARDLGAQQRLGVVEQAVHQRPEPLDAVAARELLERRGRRCGRRRPAREVAEQLVRHAHVGAEDLVQRVDRLAAVEELAATAGAAPPGRPRCCRRRIDPGHAAADVGVVRDRDREADQRPVEEGRLDDEDVGRVARPVEGVVDDVDVAGREARRRSARAASPSRSGSSRAGAGSSPPARPSRPTARRARPSSPSRRARPPSARCGRSSSPSRRPRSRARSRRAARRSAPRARRRPPAPTSTAVRTSAPVGASSATVQPGGTTTVVSYSSIEQRPCDGRPSEARAVTHRHLERAVRRPEVRPAASPSPRAARRQARTAAAPARARPGAARGRRPASRRRGASRRAARARPRSARRSVGERRRLAGALDRDAPALAAVAHVGDALPLDHVRRRRGRLASRPRAGCSPSRSPSRALDLAEADVVPLRRGRTAARRPRRAPRAAARSRSSRRARRRAPRRGSARSRRTRSSAKSRRSRPFSVETARSARIIAAFASSWIPRAASRAGGRPRRRLRDRGLGELARDREVAGGQLPGRDVAEHDVGVGHGRLLAAAARSRPARARRRRSAGPTCSAPAGSTQAIEPPPAPTSAMSSVGIRISSPLPRRSRLPGRERRADLVLLAARDARRPRSATPSRSCRPCRT